jgi:serine/threonine protein kinase
MTTLVHSGHKSIRPSHVFESPRAGETFPCPPSGVDPVVLGQYRILECLGAGGMGKVFRAEHQLMGRQVVIKVMSPALLSDGESCARFRQEVRLVAQLSHPHIVLAHDADEEQGLHFFVMEYVQGADLGNIVAEYGPLPIAFACECIRQTALGLQHAHEHGLVHCDIKPSNLLLRGGITSVYDFLGRPSGENLGDKPLIKILDFGLARLAGKGTGTTSELGSPELALCGTPDFMAPELGRDSTTVDIRCDLYSLGCTFSFLLTGQVPYPGGSWSEKLIRHHYDPAVPVCRMRPDVPAAIAAVVGRLMAKDPSDRFAIPGEVAAAIQTWQDGDASTERSSSLGIHDPHGARGVRSGRSEPILLPELRAAFPVAQPADRNRQSPRGKLGIRWRWPLAGLMAIGLGLGLAYLASSPMLGETVRAIGEWKKHADGQAVFRLGVDGEAFGGLERAIAAAKDGDTIFVRGDGPFILHGISCRGKALTIKAGAGFHPRFDFVPMQKDISWDPLFFADRALTFEGIHLNYAATKSGPPGSPIAHLIYIDEAPLKLVGCTLTATNAQALIVARRTQEIDIEDCTVTAQASALCLEIGPLDSTKICLKRSLVEVRDPGAAAAVFWAKTPLAGLCELNLEQNVFVGSRLLALNGLERAFSVHATDNRFHFQEALLSISSANPILSLSGLVHWDGSNNRFASGSKWVTLNAVGQPVGNLGEWKRLWNCEENGSLEENSLTLPTSVTSSN